MALTPTENDISTAFGNLSLISNSENTTITEYEPKIITAIKEIRNKKKCPDIDAILLYSGIVYQISVKAQKTKLTES